MKGLIAKKIGMTQIFTQNGVAVAVTVLQAGPCVVAQKKIKAVDGYNALQLAFGHQQEKKANKAVIGHFKKNNITIAKHLREFQFDNFDNYNVGSVINCDLFAEGDMVDVLGRTKGKGFTGTIKRHNAHRGPMAHGSGAHRIVGSLGSNTDPARVFPGKKMPGRLGYENVSIQNLKIVKVDMAKNIILVAGGVPGPNGAIVTIKSSVKNKGKHEV